MIKNLQLLIITLSTFTFGLNAQELVLNPSSITHPVLASNGMVATQHYLASEVGEDILSQGDRKSVV